MIFIQILFIKYDFECNWCPPQAKFFIFHSAKRKNYKFFGNPPLLSQPPPFCLPPPFTRKFFIPPLFGHFENRQPPPLNKGGGAHCDRYGYGKEIHLCQHTLPRIMSIRSKCRSLEEKRTAYGEESKKPSKSKNWNLPWIKMIKIDIIYLTFTTI